MIKTLTSPSEALNNYILYTLNDVFFSITSSKVVLVVEFTCREDSNEIDFTILAGDLTPELKEIILENLFLRDIIYAPSLKYYLYIDEAHDSHIIKDETITVASSEELLRDYYAISKLP